eukprot:5429429-Pyramimonas_sp.AAC.1
MAAGDELVEELLWARSRPKSLYGKTVDEEIHNLPGHMLFRKTELKELKEWTQFTDALTLWELNNLYEYRLTMRDPDAP